LIVIVDNSCFLTPLKIKAALDVITSMLPQ